MYIFYNDYKGCAGENMSLNLAHMRSFYLGKNLTLYFEYSETFETMTFDTQENATFAYQSIVGMVKALQ
jgi:hypothetical protein